MRKSSAHVGDGGGGGGGHRERSPGAAQVREERIAALPEADPVMGDTNV